MRNFVTASLLLIVAVTSGCTAAGSGSAGSGTSNGTSASQAASSSTTTAPGTKAQPELRPAPESPIAKGETLTGLSSVPKKTLGMVELPSGFQGARFELLVEPYGWGPGSEDSGRQQLLAKIVSAKALDEGAKSLSQVKEGQNMTLQMDGPMADRGLVKTGGTYRAQVSVRAQGGVGLFSVEQIDAVK